MDKSEFLKKNLNNRDAMNKKFPLNRTANGVLLGFALAFGTTHFVHAQGELASGDIASSGSNPFTYDLSFSNGAGATSPIGSVWYAWVPGQFYLPGTPTSASAPAGWTATVFGNSVQYLANSSANDIAPGQTLSGFSYQATFTPGQLAAAPNSGVSVAYSSVFFSDAGNTFTVNAVPEPAAPLLLSLGAATCWLMRRRSLLKLS
jgi:hypothetical protein